jgi:two-component system cell cycle sensor histidine kinase/response regulator CckA
VEAPSDHDILLSLGEDLPVGIWVARAPGGDLIYANRMFVEMLGGKPADLAQLGASERYGLITRDGARYPETRLPFARAIHERSVVVIDDLTIKHRDGVRIDVRIVSRPVGDPITHVVTTMFDSRREVAAERARIETETRLRRAQRFEAIGTLAGGIAHDFNNLTFGIKLIAAELAISEPDPRRRAQLESIDDFTERSATLTRSLLSFIRRGEQRVAPISVSDIVLSMSELLTRTLAGIELSFELEASDRGTVIGDQSQLEQIIMNLVLNARDAVASAGRVVVRTGDLATTGEPDAPRFVVLEVKDDGPGLLSQPPTRGSSSDAAGLDLAAVFATAERHGGSVEVDAGLDGRGTTMRVLLPAVRRPTAARLRKPIAELPKGSGLILVVDDDQMVRKVVASSLTSLGYQIVEATSGTEAVAIYRLRHDEIRAVVLDMVMPGMTGRATYLALRDVDRNVAVLLMSGHTLNEHVQEILDLGVRSFVSKPYSIAALAAAMTELTR